jgi:predicted AlkP superfamily phosphohydrolase/phosphomutase
MTRMQSRLLRRRGIVALAFVGVLALGFVVWHSGVSPLPAKAQKARPLLLVVGIDGGEWRVIERLWSQGKLPHLKAIADRGTKASLHTAYNSSPVIWTTIATGMVPAVHGITDFVVPTAQGDVPISSSVRKVPALWNMLSRVGKRVAVLGWWGSWPAESVNGVVVSDRSLLGLADDVFPASFHAEVEAVAKEARAHPGSFDVGDQPQFRDLTLARVAEKLVGERYDAVLLYFRTPDIVSHQHWAHFEPGSFPGLDPTEVARYSDRIPRIYQAVDDSIGKILAAAPRDTNVIVLSDHGFHATAGGEEDVQIELDMDAVLEALGYLARREQGVDFERSRVYTHGTPPHRRAKMLKLIASPQEDRLALRRRLDADLAQVRYADGSPVFWLRDPRPKEVEQGIDAVAVVALDHASPELTVRGHAGALAMGLHRISGTHTINTHGIFLAAGPDIQPGAGLAGINVHDMTPTLLYALGLPVADDFAGQPRKDLFAADFQRRMPVRTLKSWGKRKGVVGARPSEVDGKLLDELRSLGYLR